MKDKEGPTTTVHINKSCSGCKFLQSQKWSIEDGNDYDWGFDYTCEKLKKYIGQQPETPLWCPFDGK